MPVFEYDGKKYNVKDEHIDSFVKDFPDATSIMERDGKKYRVKSSDYRTFMSERQEERMPASERDGDAWTAFASAMERSQFKPVPILETEDYLDENGNLATRAKRVPGVDEEGRMAPEGVYRDVVTGKTYNAADPATAEVLEQDEKRRSTPVPLSVERINREQVASMSSQIDNMLQKAQEEYRQRHDEKPATWQDALRGLSDMPRAPRGYDVHGALMQDRGDIVALSTAKRSMRDAQRIIDEADHNAQEGTFVKWLESSFAGGAARGFGQKFFDFDTWDMGLTDLQQVSVMREALDAFDKGEKLTEGQQAMLDAKALELATNAYFGSYVGRGYEAGKVTAESIPFMIEMCVNPASGTGHAVQNKLVRYALKRFGKTAVKKNAKKYVAAKATARVLGDLTGSAMMAATTGSIGTAADAMDRMNGDVEFDTNQEGESVFAGHTDGEDFYTAFGKAFAARTIENYSEMFGEYFAPVLDPVTKGMGKWLSKAAGSKAGKKLGLDAVNDFMQNVAASDVAKIITDFEEHSKWNGMFGEYAEEVAGGIMNALVVGDQTLDTAEGTGVFNLDNNIDTFLGVSLMGGFMSAVKTAGYRTPKYRARRDMTKMDNEAAVAFGNPERWGEIRNRLAFGDDAEVGQVLRDVVSSPDLNETQRAAALGYAKSVETYRGMLQGEAKKREDENADPVQTDAETSFDNGYSLESAQEMNDARNMYEYQRQRVDAMDSDNLLHALNNDPIGTLHAINADDRWSDGEKQTFLDYVNAKATYDGMIQRVRDDMDGRIDQSDALIASRTNRNTGMVQGATMKQDDRKVYVVVGNVVPYDDGTGVDIHASDGSLIVRDAETGALEQVSPEALLSVDLAQDPAEQRQLAADAIRAQLAPEAADKIDGKVVSFNAGDSYTITSEEGNGMQVQIVADENGIVDNGDGTVNVSDGGKVFPVSKEIIQQSVDAANIARVAEFERQKVVENVAKAEAEAEAGRPQYAMNDLVSFRDENGRVVRGSITADEDADGRYEVYTEVPINGKRVNMFTREEIDSMLAEHNGQAVEELKPGAVSDIDVVNEEAGVGETVGASVAEGENTAALRRIPVNEKGEPVYEQAETPDIAWDAIVEQTEGDEAMAQTVVDGMVADKEAALKKLEKAKPRTGTTIVEKIAAEKEHKTTVDAARQEVEIWKKIAGTSDRRKMKADAERRRATEEAAAVRRAEEERLRAEREEAERMEREALNGVPDMVDDTPQDARARGYRRVNGHKIDRQEPLQGLRGKKIAVKFSDDTLPTGRVAVIESEQLQPSHIQGVRNPLHFIDEAQPKERNDEASVLSARKIADGIRPEEITASATAYTGAPTVNARGEAIQGNNRSDALRLMWTSNPEQAAKYKQYLMDYAREFGLDTGDIAAMQHPVLVNMLDVEDADAITLGQFVAQDTESGGVERIKPKNAVQKMGDDMRTFANMLLSSADDETSFAGLVDNNGAEVLGWMSRKGYITPTQFQSTFDSKGNLTAEAKNDLRGIMYQSIFQNGNTQLEEMFNALPVKSQRAILATAYRDYESPSAERMLKEIQNSIRAYYALSKDVAFASSKNWKEARMAVEGWKMQYEMDDVTGESYLPAEKFSNLALHLATMYKGESQNLIQGTFNQLYDLIQGTQEETLFEKPDNTPRTLMQAIKEALNIDYNGEQRSDVLAGDSAAGQEGEQGSTGNVTSGERVESGERPADGAEGTGRDNGRSRTEQRSGESETATPQIRLSKEEAIDIIANMELLAVDDPKTPLSPESWQQSFGLSNSIDTPLGKVKMGEGQYQKLVDKKRSAEFGMVVQTLQDPDVVFIEPSEAKEGQTTERNFSYVFVKTFIRDGQKFKYYTSVSVLKDGMEVSVSSHIASKTAIMKKLQDMERAYTKESLLPNSSEWHLAEHPTDVPDLLPTQGKSDVNVETSARTEPQQPNNAVSGGSSLPANDKSGISNAEPNGEPTVSDSKDTTNSPTANELSEKNAIPSVQEQVQAAEAEVNIAPTEKQKEAGNYKKGHVQIGSFDITIEQPRGSVRSGVDANGKAWETEMRNTYGYIRGTKGVDGDHIDVFLSNDIYGWDGRRVFVVDQYNEDGTFDEHKVMLGFNDIDDAEAAYFANYDKDWGRNRRIDVTLVTLDEFEKWIDSSHRKTKAFTEYRNVEKEVLKPGAVSDGGNEAKLSDQSKPVEKAPTKNEGAFGLVSDERMNELKERLRKKLGGQLNMGIDPEILAIGMELAVGHIDRGIKSFADFSNKMIEDLGDVIRPYLKAFYNGARDLPEVIESGLHREMTSYDEVSRFDVANFDKQSTDLFATAEMVVSEQEKMQQADKAKQEIEQKRKRKTQTALSVMPDLFGDSKQYVQREAQEAQLAKEVGDVISLRVDMMQLEPESVKPLTMTEVKKMASKYSELKTISDTDLQELVELAMTELTRPEALANVNGSAERQRSAFEHIVKLYRMQPSLNARDSERLMKQQYSTPTPFGYVMGQFVLSNGKKIDSMLEPSAGNGALTIALEPSLIHVNDIDDARLANLRKLGYGSVTAQDALLPFTGGQVDVIMTNPPFGNVTEKIYDGVFRIASLEGQMAINALNKMKDDGRAAIIIGGNTSYRTNGSMNAKDAAFFGYLYSHYNVVDVINISGKALYARNGTGYDVRMILINGRKGGKFQRFFPPVKSKARAEQITTFDELYKRIQDDIYQIQQVGNKSADVQRDDERAADRTESAPVRSNDNSQNAGTRQRPSETGDGIRSASRSDSEQSVSDNGEQRPAGMDNADGRNAAGTDNVQQPSSQPSRSLGSRSTQDERGGSGSNRRGAVASRPDSGTERLEVKPGLNTEKVPYPNQSRNGFTLMSVVPAAQAQVLQKSLSEIGDVDQYLVDQLGYSSKDELYSYLAAEQIDSVALAIHQMNRGNAFIIGDMTGVGKGRQGAALIRYAVKHGKVPIYFTQKPTLFTDNYRDLEDIGSSDLRPFIIASNPKDANIVDAGGNVVHKLPNKAEQERVFGYIMEHGGLPDEYDYVLTTYDQIKNGTADYTQREDGTWDVEERKLPKKSKGYTTADRNGQIRRDALSRLALGIEHGNIAILDESHTVGGDSGCGRYMQMLTSQADGVTFLSATFAKRADNMPIYAQRTAIAEAGVKASELIEAIAKGGVTLQEIMSKQLVESGQMIRRERSFEGVTIDWLNVEEETDRQQRRQFNEVAEIFNAIRNFQDDYITPIIEAKNESAAEFGATVNHTQGTKDMGVKNVPFASKMYNLVNQLLFTLKVDAVADRVIENLHNGFKPVISFTNTMEGFLSSAPKGVAMDEVPNFSLTLMRALDGVMRFTEKDADENSEGGAISVSELSIDGQNAYNAIRDKIMNLSADLPISPMDAIRMKIEGAGYSVAEITGRTMQLNRTEDDQYIVESRADRDKKAAMRDFNSGKLDVLMINKSGSTGISLHASSKFEDRRPRVMVFAQFQSDINDEVQMRGRIDRSGQVTRGRYEYIMSTIPAEQRIQMMFKAKLKSLDANTTSSQKSKFNEIEIVDYLNKYGDEVVWEYMKEHPELEERLGDPLDMLQKTSADEAPRTSDKENTIKKSGCAGKISRYLAFLSVEEQDEIFREITETYRVKIQLLDDAGENDLEITTMPLRAETIKKQVWHEGENPGSGNAFADNTYVEQVSVDVLKKPMKHSEIVDATRKLMSEHYAEKNGSVDWLHYVSAKSEEINQFFQSKADEAVDKLKEAGEARISKAREKAISTAKKARGRGENNFTDTEIQTIADQTVAEEREKEEMKQRKRKEEIMAVRNRILFLFNRLRAENIYVVPQDLKQSTADMFSQTFGTFVGFKFNKNYTLGSSTAIFATLDGRRKVELALSDPAINTIITATETAYRYSPKEIGAITMDNWDKKIPTQTRQKRYIITGNLLQALVDTDKGEKTSGNLINYSTIDGETRQGILMGENFKPSDLRSSASLSSRLAQIKEGQTVVSENGDVQIEKISFGWQHRGDYELRVPKSTQRGGIYTKNADLLKLVDGNNFVSKGNSMVAYVTPANIDRVVDMLSRTPFNVTVLQESKLSDVSTGEAEEERERMGDGYGAYSDEEISYANDPVSKMMGENRFSKKKQAEFAKRERQRMEKRVKVLAERMNLDNVEIVTDASQLEGRRAKAKGFYSRSTGKITIVIPNNISTVDAEQTLLHEAVAHYGLRQLFGKQFDTFLDNVFANADEEIRREIVEMAKKHGWNFHTATEEYLASLAEETDFERLNPKWWQKIKSFFLDLLHDIGFEGFNGVTLTDNELRYILWRSYGNLAEPGKFRSIFGEAADVAKQYELKVGEYASEKEGLKPGAVAESVMTEENDDDVLMRDGDPVMYERALARDRYEERMRSGMYQSQEALQDSMLSLKEAMLMIDGRNKYIEDVEGFENAYLGENRLSSTNQAEADAFANLLFKPLLKEVARLAKTGEERDELMEYMMAKHGLERNRVMAERDAKRDFDEHKKQHPTSKKTLQDFIDKYRERDYAGLTALTGMDGASDAEAEAQSMVDDYEQAHDTDQLWKKVNAVSNAILSKQYECGMMDKATYEKIAGMYKHYIPLRGFDEETSAEAYAYLPHKESVFNAPISRAEGRTSKADDPLANLQSMAESAIMQGNRNKLVKQKFLNFVLNHPSDLVSVSELWLQYDAVSDEWNPVFPDNIDVNDSPDEVEQKMHDFETRMEQLAEASPDTYKRGKDAANIPYRVVESRDMRQHQVIVRRNGKDYVLTINGNPRLAQALNGQTNPDNDISGAIGKILKASEWVNRQLSAFYTTRNPDFVVSNFMRDMLYANTMVWIKESPNYALRFHRNMAKANIVQMKNLLAKHRNGSLDIDNPMEKMFHQFMMNGGETGYTSIRDMEQHKKDIQKELRRSNGKLPVGRAIDLLGEQFDEVNRAIENSARFAAFMTSREMGRTVERSIYDAKEISVNFNKKGSGAKFLDANGQTRLGNASAFLSGIGRSGYVFWNAAIQGTTNFGRQMKRHPAKAFTGVAAMFILGALIASMGGDDDDKNAYYNQAEHVRRSNILFRVGDYHVSIPLPVEYRAIYGMGELMMSVLNEKEHYTSEELAMQIASQLSQVLPLDLMNDGGLQGLIPSGGKPVAEVWMNKSWTGMPIYKDTEYNKNMPEWTKAYKSANKHIVNLAATLNEATGGDKYTPGGVDINPAKVEHLLNGYFGGVFSTIDKMTKSAETIAGEREFDPRSFLLVNRLVKAGDERTEYRAVNNEYFRLKDEHDRIGSRLRRYENDTDNGIFDFAEKIDFLYNSPEYERYEIFEDYRGEIDGLYDELKEAADDEERKQIEAELNAIKKEMIEKMNETRNRE